MNTKQTGKEQAAAIRRRKDLFDLKDQINLKGRRHGLTDREKQLVKAVDAELEALRKVGSSQTGQWREPAIVSHQVSRRRRSTRAVPKEFRIVGGGLPGTGR